MDYVGQEYWDQSYENLKLEYDLEDDDAVVKLIKQILVKQNLHNGDVFEIGCYPGRYLKVFGDFGLCLNGVDTTAKVLTDLPAVYKKQGYCIGKFLQEDIFKHEVEQQYDVVCSFGFIEHFENWEEVILMHLKYLKKGGLLFITVPNFSGFFQKYFHYFFDKQNLDRHNLKAMNVSKWINVFDSNNINYEVLFQGAFGEFEVWFDEEERSPLKRFTLTKTLGLIRRIKKLPLKTSTSYSPYLGLVLKVN